MGRHRTTPAFVIDDLGALLVQNRMSKLVSGDQTSFTGRRRNHTWRWFTEPESRAHVPEEDWAEPRARMPPTCAPPSVAAAKTPTSPPWSPTC